MKFVKYLLIFLLFLFVLLGVLIKFSLPNYDGKIYSPKIKSTVQIFRDDYDMPIIKAENEEDLAFGIGYAMAQDRLFQMDLIRRAIQGKLSEILGESLIPTDKFFLTITAGRSLDKIYQDYPEN
ncbi:MAG: penicillin acylase family protein, partial [Leptonema sp. (in: bacteria)]